MLNKIELFNTRIFHKEKTYLLVSDVAKALGYKMVEDFIDEHPELITFIDQMPKLVSETDFNWLLCNDAASLKRMEHLEITKIDTLRLRTEEHKSLYPLKVMFATEMFKRKASHAGFTTIEEYIENVDYPIEIQKMIEEIQGNKDVIRTYKEQILRLQNSEFIDYQLFNKLGLEIQSYTRIKEGKLYLESFIAGKGIFYMIYLGGDEDYTGVMIEDGEWFVPEYDFTEDKFVRYQIGKDITERDYRQYGVLENVLYVLMNKKIDDAGVDLLECSEAGVKMYISQSEALKIFAPNMYRELLLVEGIVVFSCTSYLTENELCKEI